MRRKVCILAGAGMSHEEIALALGIGSRVTLTKHFGHELTVGAYQRRAEVADAMYRAAKKGSVAAARVYLQQAPRAAAAAPADLPDDDQPAEGKKERAQREAAVAHVGTEWDDILNLTKTVQ